MRKIAMSVTLSPFEAALLQELATNEDRSLSYMLGKAVERYAYHGGKDYGEWGTPTLSQETLDRLEKEHLVEQEAAR